MRFTDVELGLMKALFAENDDLMFAVRNFFVQINTKEEETLLKKAWTKEVAALLRKSFLPHLDGEAPLFQLSDMHVAHALEMKQGNGIDAMWPLIRAKEIVIKYLGQRLDKLDGEKVKDEIVLSKLISDLDLATVDREDAYVNIYARNYALSYVESRVQEMKVLAGTKLETPQETRERLAKQVAKNSSR